MRSIEKPGSGGGLRGKGVWRVKECQSGITREYIVEFKAWSSRWKKRWREKRTENKVRRILLTKQQLEEKISENDII